MQQLNRQVIITSDRLPSQLKTVDERLASRLTQTGAYDIQFPSLRIAVRFYTRRRNLMG